MLNKLKKIKLIAMDVDGTMTNGGLYYSTEGLAMKRFYAQDGMGITLLNQSGILSAIISSDMSDIPLVRAERLHITHFIGGAAPKEPTFTALLQRISIAYKEVAYIGDDINDIALLEKCGFAMCPADAHQSVKDIADYVSKFPGGKGAVRELCEMVLLAQNLPIVLI
ncbi:MAG: HAD hydrolase family protein [Ignavibacteria bacterium]|nr:HAD hydrolase family protein [Ignavibacteria bacterium]